VGSLLLSAPLLISVLSIIVGAITLLCWTYGRLIRSERRTGCRFKTLKLVLHLNNQALLAGGILFAAAWLLLGRSPGRFFGSVDIDDLDSILFAGMILSSPAPALTVIIPSLFVFFLSRSIAGNILYGPQYGSPNISWVVRNLKILRSRRDEATLALRSSRASISRSWRR
jgi:hypothetical protein